MQFNDTTIQAMAPTDPADATIDAFLLETGARSLLTRSDKARMTLLLVESGLVLDTYGRALAVADEAPAVRRRFWRRAA